MQLSCRDITTIYRNVITLFKILCIRSKDMLDGILRVDSGDFDFDVQSDFESGSSI